VTYFGFLARYIVAPTLLLRLWELLDKRGGRALPNGLRGFPLWDVLGLHAAIALLYTTPWDNYLVATKVWWYDKARVTGKVIGYVPLEEYTFFILQPLLTGAWLGTVGRYLPSTIPPSGGEQGMAIRRHGLLVGGIAWLLSTLLMISGVKRTTYLTLLLSWALPPLLLQWAFGGDILWRRRGLVTGAILPATLYLALADRLAIANGNWTISPEKTVGVHLFRKLPLEEFLFFFVTNILITSGAVLMLDSQSKERSIRYGRAIRTLIRRWLGGSG